MRLQEFLNGLDHFGLRRVEQSVVKKLSDTLLAQAAKLERDIGLVQSDLKKKSCDFELAFVSIEMRPGRSSALARARQVVAPVRRSDYTGLYSTTPKVRKRCKKRKARKKELVPRGPAKIKYSDGKGNEWSGRGREPLWLKGRDRNEFLITEPQSES